MDISLIERVCDYARGAVREPRFLHSLRTAETARRFCDCFGYDADAGYLAGIAHDMCKEMPARLLLSLSRRDGLGLSELEKEKPSLLHGRAAAVKLCEDFGVYDEDVLNAVRNHTFGRAGMGMLEKIMYVSDKVEPGRENSCEERICSLLEMDLDCAVFAVLCENMDYLKKKNKPVAKTTLQLYEQLRPLCAKAAGDMAHEKQTVSG